MAPERPYPELLQRFGAQTVLVVGDVCLDRYVFGKPTRLSREAPIAVLEWLREHSLPGAASNPALNLAALGSAAYIAGIVGDDPVGSELVALLSEQHVRTDALGVAVGRRTTEKTRLLAEGLLVLPQQLARIDRTEASPLTRRQERDLCDRIQRLAPYVDAFLISDYKGGVVTDTVVECVSGAARERGVIATVDSQGDLNRFSGFTCVRCNRAEAEAMLGRELRSEEEFARHLPELCGVVGCGAFVVTRDADGVSLYSQEDGYKHIPARRVPVADGVGAGDTFISVLTLALTCGEALPSAAYIANAAAAIVVQHVGNACPTREELLKMLGTDEHG